MSSHFLRFLIGSFSYLQVMMTCTRAWMSSKFGQMRPLVSLATDKVTVGKTASSRFFERFDRNHFILAGNDDIHKSLNEFEIRRDPTMDYGVGCP